MVLWSRESATASRTIPNAGIAHEMLESSPGVRLDRDAFPSAFSQNGIVGRFPGTEARATFAERAHTLGWTDEWYPRLVPTVRERDRRTEPRTRKAHKCGPF